MLLVVGYSWHGWHQLPVINCNETENIPTFPGHYKILSSPLVGDKTAGGGGGFEGREPGVLGRQWQEDEAVTR